MHCCRYILIRRNGVANELEASSRNYNPLAIFDDLKYMSIAWSDYLLLYSCEFQDAEQFGSPGNTC